MKWWQSSFLIIVLSFLLGVSVGQYRGKKGPQTNEVARVDTLVRYDTVRSIRPVYMAKKVVDTIRLQAIDTIRLHDTLYVWLQREQIEWEDSLAKVYASGIRPAIDSVVHYRKELHITAPVPRKPQKRWGIGVQSGVGMDAGGSISPYIGVGISYELIRF